MQSFRALFMLACAATAMTLFSASAGAADVRINDVRRVNDLGRVNDLQLSCEGGRTYVIRARGVSAAGEMVTGYLLSSPRRGHYVRLIPMGDGYRYAGRGIWLDGKGATADLHLGKRRSYSCTVGTLA
jgi:hypothetical protein